MGGKMIPGNRKPVMSNPKRRAYRVAVAIAFGLIGFGVNFLDIELMEGATFKISILVGLFFPLVVALAWGWRYGLLSSLAGGCQAMWFLWHGDGWGVFYSVPVFTLWIVWHGWWAEHRPEDHPWYVSLFAVEFPIRIVIELGFLVVFRWLVSLNPPPWNSAISWDHVSSVWLQTVAVKHFVEAYVLLLAAYVALSLGPVRRFFGLPPRSAQRDTSVIYAGAALFGMLLWLLDVLVHYFGFPNEGQSFWGFAVHGASAHEVFMRFVYVAAAMLVGAVLARLNRHRVGLQELLDHRNRILAAIRNINQLIVREKDPHRLLDEVCRLLVETHGYYNAWIILTAGGRPKEPFFHAGFNGSFAPMAERLLAGDLPFCAQAALSSDSVQVNDKPHTKCSECPLASTYSDRAGVSLRLEHAGRIFGWISLSCPDKFFSSTEEHDLLKEVAGDIAFALWAIETEARGETLARKYASVLTATSDAVVASDLDGRITVFNPGAEKMFGCMAEEVLGSSITRFCPEDRIEQQAEMRRRVLDTGAVPRYETEQLSADGQRVPVEITLNLNTDDQGRPLRISAILRNISERKRAEEALKESKDRLRSTLDGLSAHIAVLNDHGEIILTNKAYRNFGELNGLASDAISEGTNYLAVCDTASARYSEEAAPFAEGIREVLSGKRLYFELEYPCHSPDEKRWFAGRVTPIQSEGPGRVVVAHENITKRKQAEESLRESEMRFRFLVDHSYDLIWKLNADGVFSYISPSWKARLGYESSFLLGKAFQPFVHPDDVRTCEEYMSKVLEAQSALPGPQYRVRHADGTWRWHEAGMTPVYARDGSFMNFVGVSRDVSERKRVEQALRESEERFRAANDASLDALMLLRSERDETGEVQDFLFVEVNRRTEEMLHMNRDQLLGKRLCEMLPINREAGFYEKYKCVVDTGVPLEEEFFLPETHVPAAWYYHQVVKVHDGIFICHRDIGERKRAEAERENLQAQLRQAQKMESVGRLAGGVAHDFNNMLGIIIGHADIILEQMAPDQPFHDDLMEIRKAGVRSADLTRQLLAFARKQTVAPKVINLNDTLEGMLKLLRRLIGEGIDLAWRPGNGVWPVKIDPAQIDQILANLCVNARDAIAGVGKITIETSNTVLDEAYCKGHAGFVPGSYVILAVSDNGCGMDYETISHLFEPFFTTKELGKGTGLGLATVYGIVKQNNSFINVYSKPGQGTTINIYLPRYLSKMVTLPDKEADKQSEQGFETVLLVEDEPAILRMTAMMLEAGGYAVLAADTPGEAIRLANEHAGDIHLLMSDVVMPEMNGRDLARDILSIYPHIKCLFMSGYTANVIAHHGVLDDGVNFIQKPFSKGDLNSKVREILDRD